MKLVTHFLLLFFTMNLLHADGRLDGEALHKVTDEFETPHLNWAQPLAGGAIRTLFITHRRFGAREIVELAQRFDIDYEAFVAKNFTTLADDNIYDAAVIGTSRYEKNRELIEKLRQPWRVIVLANVRFSALPPEAQYRLLKHVSNGAGLVITYPEKKFPFPKVLKKQTEDAQKILSWVDAAALPDSSKLKDQFLKTYLFGKGRIALLDYGSPKNRLGLTAYEKYAPKRWKARYENNLALTARVIQWTAGGELSPVVRPEIKNDKIRLAFIDNPAKTVHLRVRDASNYEVAGQEFAIQGSEPIELDIADIPAGQYFVDARLGDKNEVTEFGVWEFEKMFSGGTFRIKTDKASYEAGEAVTASVTLENPPSENSEIIFTLEGLPDGRLWAEQRVPLSGEARKAEVTFSEVRIPVIAALAKAELRIADKPVVTTRKILYFPRRHKELFPTIFWSNIPEALSEMFAAQINESIPDNISLNHPGTNGEKSQLSALFNQRSIPYLTRIGLAAGKNGETLSKHWLGMSKEEIQNATGGDGSFNNPAVRDFWKQNIERRMAGLPEIGPFIYTLGDENYFSYEAGYSPSDNPAFTQFLKDRYGDISSLNKAWNTSHKSFEAIGHPTPQEMRDQSLYPAWYAHRSFMEKQYADTHHFLAREIKTRDPHALVGAEGSVPGDLELTLEGLDFWGPYKDPVNDELLRSLAPEKLRTIWWGYRGEQLAYPLWRPLLKGVVNGNAWYSANIEPISGLMSVDFSLAEFYKNDRKPHVDALNRGSAQLLISTPLRPDGIAILWSHASQSASVMEERFPSPRDSAVPLINHLYEIGLNFDILTAKMLENGALAKYKILWMPGATALSEKESQAIETFVREGGIAIADLNPGILNDSCATRPVSQLSNLFNTPSLHGKSDLVIKEVDIRQSIRDQPITFHAKKAWQSPEVPVFTVHEFGKGLAILLNFNLSSAQNTSNGKLGEFLTELLALADIRSDIEVDGIDKKDLILRLRENDENQVLGLLANPDNIGKTATLRLPQSTWVYEADKGLIGNTDTIQTTLDVPFKVFNFFSGEQKSPVFSLSDKTCKAGQSVELEGANLSAHGVYRIEIFGPAGKVLPHFTRVFAGQPKDEDRIIRFALNDPPGDYQITLTDTRTGLQSTQVLTLTHP
ncbi:MAG: beta-galactosidase [Chthoniobacterales bacterium]